MPYCYYCGCNVSSREGVRADFPTSRSYSTRGGSRVYWSRVTLCQNCASSYQRALIGVPIAFGVILLFLFMWSSISKEENVSTYESTISSVEETPSSIAESDVGKNDVEVTSSDNFVSPNIPATVSVGTVPSQSLSNSSTRIVQAKDGYANLRAYPSTEVAVESKIPNGTSVNILHEEMNSSGQLWYEVQAGDQIGWIYSGLLD